VVPNSSRQGEACVYPESKAKTRTIKTRQALALPIYALALIPSYLSDALGDLAAWIAGDN
jgi:hypothetical protein